MVDGYVAVGDPVNDPLCSWVIYFRSWECFGDGFQGDTTEGSFDGKKDAEDVTFLSYSAFNFVQGCFSGATLSEAELPFVQVSGNVEAMLHVPQQYFLGLE